MKRSFESLKNQNVLVIKKDNKEVLIEPTNIYEDGVSQERLGEYTKTIKYSEISEVEIKKIKILPSKRTLSDKKINLFNTQIIEQIKNSQSSYKIITRNKKIKKNGKIETEKIKKEDFEILVFKFFNFQKSKKGEILEILPLAIINNRFILVFMFKNFLILDQNKNIILENENFSKIIKTIEEKNKEII